MSNVIAGVVRGQLPYLSEHMDQKRAIYERYRDGLRDLPVTGLKLMYGIILEDYWKISE